MLFLVGLLTGAIGAGVIVFISVEKRRRQVERQLKQTEEQRRRIGVDQIRLETDRQELTAQLKDFEVEKRQFSLAKKAFDAKIVSYSELQVENGVLKRDLNNLDIACRKLQMDHTLQQKRQEELDQRGRDLGSRYLKENAKRIGSSLNLNNLTGCEERLRDVIERCRGIGLEVPLGDESVLFGSLRQDYQEVTRAARLREEEAARREQERDELARQREDERRRRELADTKLAEEAKARAIADVDARHAAEIKRTRAEMANAAASDRERVLAEAEEKYAAVRGQLEAEKAQLEEMVNQLTPDPSRAQLGHLDGHVCVISNIGSFGEGVFKIGMTLRNEYQERIDELGDASVPFPFDAQIVVSADDARKLERELHEEFRSCAINLVNLRKEFFRTDLNAILGFVKKKYGEGEMEPEGVRSESGIRLVKFEENAPAEQYVASKKRRKTSSGLEDSLHEPAGNDDA